MPSHLIAVVGGQYGSEGKGAIAAHLARQYHGGRPTATIRVAGPNAGHTSIDDNGTPWPLRTIPATAPVNPTEQLLIAPGSEIDPTVLDHELTILEQGGHPVNHRLTIDPQATILDPIYIEEETALTMHERLGSTGKGIGAARAARIMRTARTWGDRPFSGDTVATANDILDMGGRIIIEGTQGYGLGLHAGHYPQCTSSDCRAIDFCAMAGLNPWQANIDRFTIYVTIRPNPIRVAGPSGPLHGETTWEALGLPVELTTVTKKPRRVGSWDADLVKAAVQANGGAPTVRLAVTMMDHVHPEIAGWAGEYKIEDLPAKVRTHIWDIESDAGANVYLVGTGPATVMEVI